MLGTEEMESMPKSCPRNCWNPFLRLRSSLVSLVSDWGRNWCYLCGTVERVAQCEIVEIVCIHVMFAHVAGSKIVCRKQAG